MKSFISLYCIWKLLKSCLFYIICFCYWGSYYLFNVVLVVFNVLAVVARLTSWGQITCWTLLNYHFNILNLWFQLIIRFYWLKERRSLWLGVVRLIKLFWWDYTNHHKFWLLNLFGVWDIEWIYTLYNFVCG